MTRQYGRRHWENLNASPHSRGAYQAIAIRANALHWLMSFWAVKHAWHARARPLGAHIRHKFSNGQRSLANVEDVQRVVVACSFGINEGWRCSLESSYSREHSHQTSQQRLSCMSQSTTRTRTSNEDKVRENSTHRAGYRHLRSCGLGLPTSAGLPRSCAAHCRSS